MIRRRIRTAGSATAGLLLFVTLLASCVARGMEDGTLDGGAAGPLANTSWRLVEFVSSDDAIGTVRPSDPDRYTLSLQPDGTASLRLDCNRGAGQWSAEGWDGEGGAFSLGPLSMTRAYCGPRSMDQQIARHAEYMRSFLLRGGRLYVNLMADGGTYVWEPAEAP
jgi:heat shock protein HslJ